MLYDAAVLCKCGHGDDMAHLCRWALRFGAAVPASAGMAMIWPTYAGGLCDLMLLCLASAGMAVIGPNDAGGLCALMLLCLASEGMALA